MNEIEEAYRRAVDHGEPMIIPAALLPELLKLPATLLTYNGIAVVIDTGDDDDLFDNNPPGEVTLWTR